jgi:hypothetical protein
LTVERVLAWDGIKAIAKWHGARLQHESFTAIRAASAKDGKSLYDNLRGQPEYEDLPQWQSQTKAFDALRAWEESHLERCTRQRDDGQFFGFREVGQGYLGRFTRFLFVPAVRDASDDATETRGSALTQLMDMVVRSIVAQKKELVELRSQTLERYREIMDPGRLVELGQLAERMTATLRTFAPGTGVDLQWLPLENIDVPMPKADVRLVEDDYSSPVSRTGHGLQRAFILTMLQHLALARASEESKSGQAAPVEQRGENRLPNLALAIEEPELYQHPSRQRHLAKILRELASGRTPGVAERTQILYGTHSPLFVGIDRVEQIRLLRKVTHTTQKPKVTRVVRTDLDKVAETLWRADGQPDPPYTSKTLAPRLRTIMTPWMSEGFFATTVVLVEGEDDRSAVLGMAQVMGYDLESLGFAVIPCGGKASIDRPAVIFRQLGIPVYLLWDSDKGHKNADPKHNNRLLRLMGVSLTALQYTRPRRPVYATRDRPMYTSHDRPVYTTRDRLVYTTPDRPVCTTYGVRLHSPPTMSPGGAIHGAHTHELSA